MATIDSLPRSVAIALAFALTFAGGAPRSQDPAAGAVTAQLPGESKDASLATMRALLGSIENKRKELQAAQEDVAKEVDVERRRELAARAGGLQAELDALQTNLQAVMTGIDLEAFGEAARHAFDLKSELEKLVRPLVQQLKEATEDPRQIEQLRSDVSFHEQRLVMTNAAIRNINRLHGLAADGDVKDTLTVARDAWVGRREEVNNQLTVARYQLESRLKARKSLIESSSNLIGGFFRTRGMNLLLSLLAFGVVFLSVRWLHTPIRRIAFRSNKRRGASFYARLFTVLYHVLGTLGALVAALLVLYVAGDWVLLGLALIFLLGLAWASKNTAPKFFEQIRLLLNLGSVREREKVVFNGLPWRVDSLSIYTRLVNPELTGGVVRLPIRDLVGLHSRPCTDREIWFPCKEGDWVLLAEGTRGRVVSQTPEAVQVVQLGGARVTYQTAAFLENNPRNLSANFRRSATFGVDYQHQAISTTEIPQIMHAKLKVALEEIVSAENLLHLSVEFKEAGSSSLDYEVLADFAGAVASRYDALGRAIQRCLVDACNENDWVIPFTQVTLHQALPA